MNKQEIIAILRSAPSRAKLIKTPTMLWLDTNNYGYDVLEDGTINVNGNIMLDMQGLYELPVDFSMCVIDGYFDCSLNYLRSLNGCPKVVRGIVHCYSNVLENLKHIPKAGAQMYRTDFGHFDHYSEIPKELL